MSSDRLVKPSLGFGLARNIRKSASHEPVMGSSSSYEEEHDGGARLSAGSLTPSPAEKAKRRSRNKSVSESGGSRPSSAGSFHLGTNTDDDVFAEDEVSTIDSQDDIDARMKSLDIESFKDKGKQVALASPPRGIDAQGIFPSSACMFAANLSQDADDITLEAEVTKVFSQYGEVYVKIKRDSRHMPFAFCQFTREEDAVRAEKLGKGTVILGRPCRTEKARANSSFTVSKRSGEPITIREAENLLGSLGEVAKVEHMSEHVQRELNLAPSIVASYKKYDPKRDVVQSFRNNNTFQVLAYDPKLAVDSSQRVRREPPRYPSSNSSQAFLDQYYRDRRSAYFGNLPLGTTDETLMDLASECGPVVSVQTFKKPINGAQAKLTCFGFVEYVRPESRDEAISVFNGFQLFGYRIRVQRKLSKDESPDKSRTIRQGDYRTADFRQIGYSHATFPRRRGIAHWHGSSAAPRLQDVFRNSAENAVAPEPIMPEGEDHADLRAAAAATVTAATGTSSEAVEKHTETPRPAPRPVTTPSANTTPTVKASTAVKQQARTPLSHPGRQPLIPQAGFSPAPFGYPQHPMQWMPHYPPYPFSPMAPFSPLSPNTASGMMYGNMLQGYPAMYSPDMYGLMSPGHGIPMPLAPEGAASIPEEAEQEVQTPTRSARDDTNTE